MARSDPETTRQVEIMAAELRQSIQARMEQLGLNGRVLVSPYRDSNGILRVLVNLDGWQGVALTESLSDLHEMPKADIT